MKLKISSYLNYEILINNINLRLFDAKPLLNNYFSINLFIPFFGEYSSINIIIILYKYEYK